MKKGGLVLIVILGFIFLIGVGSCTFYTNAYNQMVSLDEGVSGAWAQVQNVYQRRLDLIPNLVETVKGYAAHEATVFSDIAEARSRVGGVVKISSDDLNDPVKMEEFQEAQNSLSGALQRLLVVSENYPELKADQNFLALQDQLEGTENRISVERSKFNERVTEYNTFIRSFPKNFIANMAGFQIKDKFIADSAAQNAPSVSFN